MNDKLRELVAKAINQNLVVKTNSEGRHFVSLLDPDGDHLFSAPDWGWYEGTVRHRDEMAKRITEIVAAALAASEPMKESREELMLRAGPCKNCGFDEGVGQVPCQPAPSDLRAKLEALRDELANTPYIPNAKFAERLTAILEGKP